MALQPSKYRPSAGRDGLTADLDMAVLARSVGHDDPGLVATGAGTDSPGPARLEHLGQHHDGEGHENTGSTNVPSRSVRYTRPSSGYPTRSTDTTPE